MKLGNSWLENYDSLREKKKKKKKKEGEEMRKLAPFAFCGWKFIYAYFS